MATSGCWGWISSTKKCGISGGCMALLVAASLSLWSETRGEGRGAAPHGSATADDHDVAHVFVFDKNGRLVGPIDAPKLQLSDAEWKRRLTPKQYQIARRQGTEPAFCGTLLDNHKEGVYTCVGCGLPLFSSDSKFQSGTGWPSFFRPIGKGNVVELADHSGGTERTEIRCARCDCHLGHVFSDGPAPTGLRFCLNSESLQFTGSNKLSTLADPLTEKRAAKSSDDGPPEQKRSEPSAGRSEPTSKIGPAVNSETTSKSAPPASKPQAAGERPKSAVAVFAGGCFWCLQAAFQELKGVTQTQCGYAGGTQATANYADVHLGHTRHAEVVKVTYDPSRISYEQLLDVFFDAHHPTQLNRQGVDVGTQYRSAIFFADDEQKHAAESKIEVLSKSKKPALRIVTKLEPLDAFYPAEAYHQDYARRNQFDPYIQSHALPKVFTVRQKHPELIRSKSDQDAG